MKTVILCIALASFLIFSSCSDDSPTNSSSTTYKYTAYDSSWNKIITGSLWIEYIDSVEVKGGWRFYRVSNCENMGPQIGNGNFEGTTDMWGHILLNLNPGMIDNNVLLEGSMQISQRIDGQWTYVGFPGVINWGRFEAVKLN